MNLAPLVTLLIAVNVASTSQADGFESITMIAVGDSTARDACKSELIAFVRGSPAWVEASRWDEQREIPTVPKISRTETNMIFMSGISGRKDMLVFNFENPNEIKVSVLVLNSFEHSLSSIEDSIDALKTILRKHFQDITIETDSYPEFRKPLDSKPNLGNYASNP